MKKSRAITLSLLGTAMLAVGCGSRSRTFYDAQGKVVPRSQWRDSSGNPKQLYDAQGNPVPPEEVNAAYTSSSGSSSTYRRSGSWLGPSFWSGSSTRSTPSTGSSVTRSGFGGTSTSGGS